MTNLTKIDGRQVPPSLVASFPLNGERLVTAVEVVGIGVGLTVMGIASSPRFDRQGLP
jgi:hypothetical protein